MKTADGIEFVEGMPLYEYGGNPVGPYEVGERISHGVTYDGDKFCAISALYASGDRAFGDWSRLGNFCIVCRKFLKTEPGGEFDVIRPVYKGLVFRATGNYGSTIFDPPGGEIWEVVICDECVAERKSQVTEYVDASYVRPGRPGRR